MVSPVPFASKLTDSLQIIRQIEDFDLDHGTSVATQLGEDRRPQRAYDHINHVSLPKEAQYHGFVLLYLWLYSHRMDALDNASMDYPDRIVWILWDSDLFWLGGFTRRVVQRARRALDRPDSYTLLMEQIIDRLRTWATADHEVLPEWIELVPADSPLAKMLDEYLNRK